MEPSTVQVAGKAAKPGALWILITIAAGIGGSMAAIGVAGSGRYDVAPFEVELRAFPAPLGETVLAKRAAGIEPGRAEAGTHNAPMVYKATITGVSLAGLTPTDQNLVATPEGMATFLSEQGKDALRAFGIKLALLSVGGGAIAGLGVSLVGRQWRRIAGGAAAGLLTLGVIGVLTQQTYDKSEFAKTRFVVEEPIGGTDLPIDPLPGG